MTPEGKLFHAVKHGYYGEAKEAIAAGADATLVVHKGKSLLRLAGERGDQNMCLLLVEAGLDPNQSSGPRSYSLLHNAAASGNYGFARAMLECGANPSPKSSNQATPIHMAARNGEEFLANLLLESGAGVNDQDAKGQTPLHLAVRKGNSSMAKFLIRKGADADQEDRCGMTPARLAGILGEIQCKELIRGDRKEVACSETFRQNTLVADSDSGQRR